ncbi:hypothetical protein M433DRAFT_72874 [Acidomyces richmondensis BFW]|nr:MAG: hypothetical protein FE78DRAFT_174803 [Acidomyces sp. 'richmondensis']KYG42883.1 hypothetical protein M433DRAFT_72874 [Acidomyces richmondensis BFW]
MSLAASLSSDGMRPASFLPSIKCSSCGDEIEIAAMGDHTCNKAPPSPKAQPASLSNPFTLRQLNANGVHTPSPLVQSHSATSPQQQTPRTRVRAPTLTANSMPAPKPMRPAPPRINPEVANLPFLAPRPPRSQSPMSPAVSVRSASSNGGSRPPPLRSMTSPAPRIFDPRPPSPELSSNLDCAFPPFPPPSSVGSSSRPGTSNGRNTPNSDRGSSRAGSRQGNRLAPDKDPFSATPRSPLGYSGDGLVQRNVDNDPPPLPTEPIPRPSTSHSVRSQIPSPLADSSTIGKFSPVDSQSTIESKRGPPPRPERPTEELLSPTFLDKLSAEPVAEMPSTFLPSQPSIPIRSTDRSKTFPLRQESSDGPSPSHALHKTPSEPQMRGRRPLASQTSNSEPSHIPQLRPRSSSRGALRMDLRLQDAPPVPLPVQHSEKTHQAGRHTPSESRSSTMSSGHSIHNSNSSVGPSPVGSAASSVDAFSPLSYNSNNYAEDERMKVPGLNVKSSQQQKPGMRAEQPAQRSPPRNFARPSPPKQPPTNNYGLPKSPVSSASTRPRSKSNAAPSGAQYTPYKPYKPSPSVRSASPQAAPALPPVPREPTRVQTPPSRRNTSARPACRGCGKIIEGKSVKAADGRLTGRWHKACFTCRTCKQPFTTADFYVLDNQPYCEQHYHEKNGSLCHGCHRGIEGQYLETSTSSRGGYMDKKFHPRCFTCFECRQVLSDDYFEITGKVFCERHALAAMRSQAKMAGTGLHPPDRKALTTERRTTKLMMM